MERGRAPVIGKPRGLPGAAAPQALAVSKGVWAIAAEIPLTRYGPEQLEAHLRDINWVADIAVGHESVVEHFAVSPGATVLPMKLFTMFSSPERALTDLRSRRREITAVLERVRGCQEWGVRVTRQAPASRARARIAPSAPSGTAFLAAKTRMREEARAQMLNAAEAAQAAFDVLSKLSQSAKRREAPPGAAAPPLVDAAFLVRSTARLRFRTAAKRSAAACRRAGADLVLTGPWPPYNFVSTAGGGARA